MVKYFPGQKLLYFLDFFITSIMNYYTNNNIRYLLVLCIICNRYFIDIYCLIRQHTKSHTAIPDVIYQ